MYRMRVDVLVAESASHSASSVISLADMPDAPNPTPLPLQYQGTPAPGPQPALARTMGLVALTIYGVGDMLGAGIYGLVGKAAARMGNAVWLAFLGSMVAALLTGLSYANIGSRYPRAAGAAYVTHRAYRLSFLSYVVGLAVTASGLTSMATGSRVIAGYLQGAGLRLPTELLAAGFLLLLAGVVFRGMRESTWMNMICTAVEVAGLLIVIAVGLRYWGTVDYLEMPAGSDGVPLELGLMMVLQGSVLTFFSFIGFEDILNVAEEVKEPRRTIPLGLILALLIATAIYMAVSISAVSVLGHARLAASSKPLVAVVEEAAKWFPSWAFTAVAVFAVANTALLNFIMGSRLLYGMSRQRLLPEALGHVHPTRRTPHVAIVVLLVVVIALALSGDITQLAEATSLLLLTVFVIVNMALVVLKFRPSEPRGAFEVPFVIPILGSIVCLSLIVARISQPFVDPKASGKLFEALKSSLIAGGIVALIAVLYLIMRPKDVVPADDVEVAGGES